MATHTDTHSDAQNLDSTAACSSPAPGPRECRNGVRFVAERDEAAERAYPAEGVLIVVVPALGECGASCYGYEADDGHATTSGSVVAHAT